MATTITAKDLAEKFKLDQRLVRKIIRAGGLKADKVGGEAKRYNFASNGSELKTVRASLRKHVESTNKVGGTD